MDHPLLLAGESEGRRPSEVLPRRGKTSAPARNRTRPALTLDREKQDKFTRQERGEILIAIFN